MKNLLVALIAVVWLVPHVLADQSSDAAIHREIVDTYNFQPHVLTTAQIAEKSAILDAFWSRATAKKELYVPALRKELADLTNPPFFLYDGSKLLMSLSKDPADRKIVLAAISHADLRDLQRIDYFYLVHSMAAQGEDTTTAAFHILDDPKFQIFIPQHVLTLAQNYSLVYMVFPTDQSFWERPATNRLRTEKDPTAQQTLLLLLFYAQTKAADDAISAFQKDKTRPAVSRAMAEELIKKSSNPGLVNKSVAIVADENHLRQKRRERMRAVSDEALLDLDSMTAQIMAKRK